MELIISILTKYWKVIVYGLMILTSFILCLIRKKPTKVVDVVKFVICNMLPSLICASESRYGHGNGALKKQYVCELVEQWCKDNDVPYTDSLKKYVSDAIQSIMKTPQDHTDER